MKKILLSTDIGSDVDDALSLLVMLNHPGIDLRGVYTVNGDVDSRSRIAKHMVDLAGKDIPVAQGQSQPLGALVPPFSYSKLEKVLVDDHFIDLEKMEEEGSYTEIIKPLEETGIIVNGSDHFAEQLSKGKHTIFSLAPMTDIAQLLRNHPQAAKNIEKIYVMAANFDILEPMEHNLRYDSTAAQEVLASDIPITIVPSDVCNLYRMFFEEARDNLKTPSGGYAKHMLLAYLGSKLVLNLHNHIVVNKFNFIDFLKDHVKLTNTKIGIKEFDRAEKRKMYFLNNLDVETTYYEPENFWQDFDQLTEQFENPKYGYTNGPEVAQIMRLLVPQDVAIHDVYVPYVFLHPEKLKTERKTITSSTEGKTLILPGEKHEIVTGFDIPHFKEFVKTYLK